MIFWVLLVIAIVITVVVFIFVAADYDDLSMAFLPSLLAGLMSALLGSLLMMLLAIWWGPQPVEKGSSTHELVALQTDSTVNGRFYLGAGYINGERTLNYITDNDGAFRVEEASAPRSVVYQDSDEPTVTVTEWDVENPWFAPWAFGHFHTYEFHIPDGSILSDYTVTNE